MDDITIVSFFFFPLFKELLFFLSHIQSFTVCDEGDVRLVDGTTADQGVVEVCMNHVWGLISDVGWDKNDAKVVCRQLNYPVKSMLKLI